MITKVEDVDKNSAFYQYMYGICNDESLADEVVRLLEDISSSAPMPYSREFCISYVIKLLEKYCSADNCELVLARYGFLDGFERKKYKRIGRRTEEYWKYACGYNQHEFISSDWTTTGTALTKLRDQHMIIIGNLDEITSKIKSENGGKLGLTESVPKKLEFPKPRKIKETNVAKQESESENSAPESMTTENQHDRENGITVKAGSISSAEAGSHVSIHITNVIREQEIPEKKLKDQDSLSPKNTEEDDKPSKKKKCPKWIIGFVTISLFLFIYYILKLNLGFTINTQLQMKKPSAIGQNQYQEEDPFSQQILDFNLGININLSISSSVADDENGEPVVNDKPLSEPIEEGSE